ncbi:hypothetical protein H9Q74_005626 [Fusarium xylarioides]|nr:hypothetical protein H9Q71_005858 [Fusarium xylarioides]KAG5824279.1 hypothetical protein H9Q74_005626 [Fusarium xylarioides]
MHTKSSLRLSFALLLLLVVETLADDDDTDFLMNVFSDLGPVLALFGEQFARQFLSETFTWYDHVIFACVPLGIMTAIAGAIRVQGHKFLKAFIGHARENKAAAEIEYMSSTSAEVGELFNGRGIVRTMGQPEIAQFIVFPDELLKEKKGAQNQSYGIHTLKSASEEGILYKEGYIDEFDLTAQNWLKSLKGMDPHKNDVEQAENGLSHSVSSIKRASPLQKNDKYPKYWESLKFPNLQLNIATEKISAKRRSIELHLAAIIAVILQASLLIIAVVIPYRFEGYESQSWGLPCYIGGSVLLFIGNCDKTQKPFTKSAPYMDVFWVQRTQRVNDQDFNSYLIHSHKQFISTSSRREDVLSAKGDSENNMSDQIEAHCIDEKESGNPPKANIPAGSDEDRKLESDFLALTAIIAGGAGFTIQFIGLRGLPWPCAVAQLGAIIVMAIIRALVRRRLGEDPNYCRAPSRYELDLLATQLVDSSSSEPPDRSLKPSKQDWTWRVDTPKHRLQSIYSFRIGNCLSPSVSNSRKAEDYEFTQSGQLNNVQQIILVRKRLGDLVQWQTEAFKPALALARSIERFLDEFMPAKPHQNLLKWRVPMKDPEDVRSAVTLTITKKGSSGWRIKVGEVEAILSLWMAHLDATRAAKTKDKEKADWQRSKAGVALGVDYCRILGPNDQRGVLERDIKWWVGNPAMTEIIMAKRMDEETASSRHRTCEASYHCEDPGHGDIKKAIHLQELKMLTDAWKRNPIHLAVAKGEYGCCKELICDESLNFKPYTLDVHGKSLFSYLDEANDDQRSIGRLLLKVHSRLFVDKDNEGQSVWHYGIKFLGEEAIDTLQHRHLSTINASNNSGETPLHPAIKLKSKQISNRLLGIGAEPGVNKAGDQSPLMFACSRGEAQIVKSLLGKNKQAAKDKDKYGKSPLHYVIECKGCNDGDREMIVKWLVSAMKEIDTEDKQGCTPLHLACQSSKSSIVSILMEKGANPDSKDDQGNNALHYSVGLSPQHGEATSTWREEIAEKILKRSPACIRDQNEKGRTALFPALLRNEEDACMFLLENNADPQVVSDREPVSPFMWACKHGGPLSFISMVILKAGQKDSSIDLNQGDTVFYQSSLARACEGNREEVVKMLLETSKSVQLEDKLDLNKRATRYSNHTPLHHALFEKNHDILKLLLDDPRIMRGLGATECVGLNLLEYAFERSDERCLTTLLLHHHTKSTVFFMDGWETIIQKHASLVDNVELWGEWERGILDPKRKVLFPIHKLAEASQQDTIKSLLHSSINVHELDEDN